MATVGLSSHDSFLFTIFLEGSACIVDKLVMHPFAPFRSDAPLAFFGAPCTPVEEHCTTQYTTMNYRPFHRAYSFLLANIRKSPYNGENKIIK